MNSQNLHHLVNDISKIISHRPSPRRDAEEIVSRVLGLERVEIISSLSSKVSEKNIRLAINIAKKVSKHYPLEYALGCTTFFGYKIKVTPAVLIPRPDTEHIILASEGYLKPNSKILDLCTGSGCIAIALKSRNPDISIVASDISEEALKIARENINYHNLDIELIKSDLFENISGKLDIIVSNPPYIPTDSIAKLETEISYEPRLALDGGLSGNNIYKRIEKGLDKILKSGGILLLEIESQNEHTVDEVESIFRGWNVKIEDDISGRPRVAIVRRK